MSSDSIDSYSTNPLFIGFVAVVAVAIALLIIFLLARSGRRKREHEARVRSELAALERERRFSASIDLAQQEKDPRRVAEVIADLFRDHLSMPVLAIYAGREGEDRLLNIYPANEPGGNESSDSTLLPDHIASSLLGQYTRPRITRPSALKGGTTIQAQARSTYETGGLNSDPAQAEGRDATSLAAFPWRGPFGWSGLIVSRAEGGRDAEALAREGEPVSRLGNSLAVALEIERGRAEMKALDERASRNISFFRSLVVALDEPMPLASIAREVAALVGADSAAIWRVERGASMLRMVAAFGLKSAEFLPLPFGQGLAGGVAESGEAISIKDAPADPRCLFPREARESGITSYLGVPIKSDNQIIGVVETHTTQLREWSKSDLDALQSTASIIAEVVKSTDTRGNRLRVESAYLGLSEAMQRLRSPDEVMEAAVEVLGHALGVSRAIVVELDSNNQVEPVRHEYDAPNVKPISGLKLPNELAGAVAAVPMGEAKEIENSREGSLLSPELVNELQLLSELAIPVKFDGRTRAFLYLHQCDRMRQWQRDEVEFADRVGRQLSLALANVKSLASSTSDLDKSREETRRANEAREQAAKAISELQKEQDRLREELERVQGSSQQLLEINRLKSDFIVNAGHELEASLQSVLGLAELLEQGSYGPMTQEQLQAVRGIYTWSRRMKTDIDWLIEYGSARSRRLEPSSQ